MTDLKDALVSEILPGTLGSSNEVKALSYAINKACLEAMTYMSQAMIYAGVDELSDTGLDILSIELRTPYYDNSLPIETKRAVIKNTIKWFFKAGTAEAVEGLVSSVVGNCEVREWFDYDGDPFHFKATIDISNDYIGPEEQEIIRRIVIAYKNARSVLDEIEYRQVGTQAISYVHVEITGISRVESCVAENYGGDQYG